MKQTKPCPICGVPINKYKPDIPNRKCKSCARKEIIKAGGHLPTNKGNHKSPRPPKFFKKCSIENCTNTIGYTTKRGLLRSKQDSKCKKCAGESVADQISNTLINKAPELKKAQRLAALNRIEIRLKLVGKKMIANFNINACKYFDSLMKEKNIYIQHALNGGEFYIKELGYWVDGYDKENNVVYEFYESNHFSEKKKRKDLQRQKEIQDFLKCEFIIIDSRQVKIIND